jgi:hypothetical protein
MYSACGDVREGGDRIRACIWWIAYVYGVDRLRSGWLQSDCYALDESVSIQLTPNEPADSS